MGAENKSSKLERYIELDLPHVIKHKKLKIDIETSPDGLSWTTHDLKTLNPNQLRELLHEAQSPLIIAEGLMMYFTHNEFEHLVSLLAAELSPRGGQLIFDWVPTIEQPPPGLIGQSLGALMRLFTGGESFIRDERSRESIKNLLQVYGAQEVQMIDTHKVAHSRSLPYPEAKTQQLIFSAHFGC